MENSKELEGIIRSLLVSNPKVTKAHSLEHDYEETEGRKFPFRKFGFNSFLEYLKSIPHVVRLEPHNGFNPDVLPIVTKNISHIDQLVTKQRTTVPKRRKTFNRRGGSNGYGRSGTFPRRRQCENIPPHRFIPTGNKGVNVSDIEYHIRGKYSNAQLSMNGIHSGQDLLSHASEMVDSVNQKVYPNLSYSSGITTAIKHQSYENQAIGIPAGMEEDFESDFEDYDNVDIKYDDAYFDNIEEETVSNYTIQRYTEKLATSNKNNEPTKKRNEEDGFVLKEEGVLEDDESNFSPVMIKNFRIILAKYPEGIWATELQQKYKEEFRVPLDIRDLGYSSVVTMASFLPNVFTYERAGPHDWKLFDARLSYNVDKVKTQADDYAGSYDDNYVPESIYENITKLVHQYPNGINSADLLSFYERIYHKKLDLEALGFKKLEDFIELLKTKITVTKSIMGHYLLLPKHKIRSLDKAVSPDEELTLPVNHIEVLVSENVLTSNDVIPMQELPEIKINSKNSSEALIEIEVRVAEVITPSFFFLMMDSNYNELQSMMEDLEKFYQQEEKNYHIYLPYLTENLFCVCKYDNLWHRAKITSLLPNNIIDIEYIDYGTPGRVKNSELRFLHRDFAKLPSQAICAKLIGIKPVGGGKKWPKEACTELLNLVIDKRLLAYVYQISTRDRTQIEIILFDTNGTQEIVCNEYLVEKGFAEFANKQREDSLEENPHSLNQSAFSSSQLNPPLIQKTEVKRTSTVPPGFESSDSANSQMYPPFQQHCHQTNNIYFAPTNCNLNEFQRNLIQPPHLFNMQQVRYQGHPFHNNWPQFPYLPPNPPYVLGNNTSMTHLLSPPYGFFPPQPPAYSSPPLNILQSLQHDNSGVHNRVGKIPGYSGDLTISTADAGRTLPQRNTRPQQHAVPDWVASIPLPTVSDLPNRVDQMSPHTPSTPKPLNTELSVTISPEYDEVADSENMFKEIESVLKENSFELDELKEKTGNEKTLQSQMSSPSLTNSSSTIDKHVSVEDVIENGEMIPLSQQIQSLTLMIDNETIPDSWEDIDPDDTPAKADNFSEDFKDPINFFDKEERCIGPNEESSNLLILQTNEMNSKNTFSQIKSIETTMNWKVIFDPDDNISNLGSNTNHSKKNPHIEENILKKNLIHKIEFKDKSFHIILVKNKYAVLPEEFYIQFVPMKFHVMDKIIEMSYKKFPNISKKDHPELFSEFNKVEFCGGADKKKIVKFGMTTSISYLSDIPNVFRSLNFTPDPELLNKLKVD